MRIRKLCMENVLCIKQVTKIDKLRQLVGLEVGRSRAKPKALGFSPSMGSSMRTVDESHPRTRRPSCTSKLPNVV